MGNFFAELKRRHIYRVAVAYVLLAWVLLQVVNNVAPVLDLPPWVARAFLLALVIGFPVAMFFAWIRELPASDAAPQTATTGLDYVLAGALVLVIALVSYQQLTSPDSGAVPQASVAPASSQSGSVSLAVLPFANLSGDATQEFFSDGITEEITAALARVKSLRMVGRSSAFQFKGQNRDLRAIGQTLNANYLIDGSVRREGDRVRITAQLVQSDNGVSLWTESYDRQMTSVFATQEDIAQAIAAALRVPLGLGQGETLVRNRTNDLDSYQQYLRARVLFRARAVTEAIAALEGVVARDPNYAPALALSAQVYALLPVFYDGDRQRSPEETRRSVLPLLDKAEMAARAAIRLDPEYSGGYAGLADVEVLRKRLTAAEDLYRQALALDASDADALDRYSRMLAGAGRLKDALQFREQIRALEPFVPIYNIATAAIVHASGERQAAMRMLEGIAPDVGTGFFRNTYLARVQAAEGRFVEAADTLLAMPTPANTSRRVVEDAAQLLRSAPTKAIAPDSLPELAGLGFIYAYVGAPERVLENHERQVEENYATPTALSQLWDPLNAPLRKTERFKVLVRNLGFVDYWRERGWPDLCRPVGRDDFVCD